MYNYNLECTIINYKNLLAKILRTCEQIYYENSFKKYDSPRTTWKLIKEKIGHNAKTPYPEVIINENGVELKGGCCSRLFLQLFFSFSVQQYYC